MKIRSVFVFLLLLLSLLPPVSGHDAHSTSSGHPRGGTTDVSSTSRIVSDTTGPLASPLNASSSSPERTVSNLPTNISSGLATNQTAVSNSRSTMKLDQITSGTNPEVNDTDLPQNGTAVFQGIVTLTPEVPVLSQLVNIGAEEFMAIDGVAFSTEFTVNYTLFFPNGTLHSTLISQRGNQYHQFISFPIAGSWNISLSLAGLQGSVNASLVVTTNNNGAVLVSSTTPQYQQFDYLDRGYAQYFRISLAQGIQDYFFTYLSSTNAQLEIYNSSHDLVFSGAGAQTYISANVSDGAIVAIYDKGGTGVDVRRSIFLPNGLLDLEPLRNFSVGDHLQFTTISGKHVSILSFASGDEWLSFSGYVDKATTAYLMTANNTQLTMSNWYHSFHTRIYPPQSPVIVILVNSQTFSMDLFTHGSGSIHPLAMGDRLDLDFGTRGEGYYLGFDLTPSSSWVLLNTWSNSTTAALLQLLNGTEVNSVIDSLSPMAITFSYHQFRPQSPLNYVIFLQSPLPDYRVSLSLVNGSITSDLTDDHHVFTTAARDTFSLSYNIMSNQSSLMAGTTMTNQFLFFILNSTGHTIYSNLFNVAGERTIQLFPTSQYLQELQLLVLTMPGANLTLEVRQQGGADATVTNNQSFRPQVARDLEYLVLTYDVLHLDQLLISYSSEVSISATVRYFLGNVENSSITLTGGLKNHKQLLDPGHYIIIIEAKRLDNFVMTLTNRTGFSEVVIAPWQENIVFSDPGAVQPLLIRGPSAINSTFLGFSLNTSGSVKIMVWNGSLVDGSVLLDFSLQNRASRFESFFASDYTTDLYLLILGEQGQNLTLSVVNTGSPSFAAGASQRFYTKLSGGMELWDLSSLAPGLSTLSLYTDTTVSSTLTLLNSTSVIADYSLSGRYELYQLDLDPSLKLLVRSTPDVPLYWGINQTLSLLPVGSSQRIVTEKSRSQSFAVPVEKFYDFLQMNVTQDNASQTYVKFIAPDLTQIDSTLLTSPNSSSYQNQPNPMLGTYYILLVSSQPTNLTLVTASKEQVPVPSNLLMTFVSPLPSQLIFEPNNSRVEPIYNGSLQVQVNITSPSGTVTLAQFSDDGGNSWRDMVFNISSGLFQFEWNSSRVPDGFHEIIVRASDSTGEFNAISITVYIDNVVLNDPIDFFYDDDPPAMTLINYKEGDYLLDTSVLFVFDISDRSGVDVVEQSSNLLTWTQLTANDSGLYNLPWTFNASKPVDYLYLRANDTRGLTDVLELKVSILRNAMTVSSVSVFYDQISPELVDNLVTVSPVTNGTTSNVTFSFGLSDANSGLAYVRTVYSSTPAVPVESTSLMTSFSLRPQLASVNHTYQIKAASDYGLLTITAEDITGNQITIKVGYYVDAVDPHISFGDNNYSEGNLEVEFWKLESTETLLVVSDDLALKSWTVVAGDQMLYANNTPFYSPEVGQAETIPQIPLNLSTWVVQFNHLAVKDSTEISVHLEDYGNNSKTLNFKVVVTGQGPSGNEISRLVQVLSLIGLAGIGALSYRYRENIKSGYNRFRIAVKLRILRQTIPQECPHCGVDASKMTYVCWSCGKLLL